MQTTLAPDELSAGGCPHPSPLPQCGRGSRECAPASALPDSNAHPSSSPSHSGCETKATKFESITQRVRDKSDQVRARHIASTRQKRPRQQAVMERVCDEKSGERRGDNLQITTQAVACLRKIFHEIKFLHRRNATKTDWKLSKPNKQRDPVRAGIYKPGNDKQRETTKANSIET